MTGPDRRALAIAPASACFGFVVFEPDLGLIDWGLKAWPGGDIRARAEKVKKLIETVRPGVLVVEDQNGSRRGPRVHALQREILRYARSIELPTAQVSITQLREHFGKYGAYTKQELALAVVRKFPELAHWFPRARRHSKSEDPRMQIFDAAELAMTYLGL